MAEHSMSRIFSGLSAFPITPADPAGVVDEDALAGLIHRLVNAGVDSIGLLGSTGTYAYLDRDARRRAITTAAAVKGAVPLIAGIGALRTDAVIRHAQDAEDAGADGLLLAPVSYTPLTDDEVATHFFAVAEATALPICIYNNPGTTHFQFSTALLQRLADHPRIVAVKMPLPGNTSIADDLAALRAALPADFIIGYSGDWGASAGLLSGADAWFSVLAGTLPVLSKRLTHAAQNLDDTEVAALEAQLAPLWDLFKRHGSLRVVYGIAQILGLTTAEPPRPILPIDHDTMTALTQILQDLGGDAR